MNKVLLEALRRIKPSDAERKEAIGEFLKIKKFVESEFGLSTELMGSIAKGTFLSGDKDTDIFVMFPKDTPRAELERRGLEIGKAVFGKFNHGKFQISYAEHPYTEGQIGEFHIEIVPAYAVESAEKIQSAVDRTPFHTKYVLEHLKNADDALLLKKFLKGIGCYGSDLKRQGFSGYLCELCIIKYGSFEGALISLQNYRYQDILDITGHYTKHDTQKLRNMFAGQPLIFIDPVDKNRNVAAVVSEEKLARFMFYAQRYLEKPDIKYFFPRGEKTNAREILETYKKTGTKIVAVTFRRPEIIEDIIYPQLRRLASTLSVRAAHAGFKVLDSWVFADKECGVALEAEGVKISPYFVVAGPTVFNPREHQKKFVSTHAAVWFRKSKYFSLARREETDLAVFLSKSLSGTKKSLHDRGIPDNFISPILSGARVISGKNIPKITSPEFWKGAGKERVK